MKRGDLVRLVSGGPVMTVMRVEDDKALCCWFLDTDEVGEYEFPVVALQQVSAPSPLKLVERGE